MKLTLHVGHYKTGSTAIQDHFARNRGAYRRRGLLYPKTGRVVRARRCHSAVAFQELHEAGRSVARWYARTDEFKQFAAGRRSPLREAMLDEVRRAKPEHVLVSTEELIRFGGPRGIPAERAAELIESFGAESVQVVCYLRRPDRYLEAWYNQLIKAGRSPRRLANSLDRFIPTVHVQFSRALSYWAGLPAVSQLSVRRYEDASDDLISDVVATVGAPRIGESIKPVVGANPRIPDQFVEFARRFNKNQPGADVAELSRTLAELAKDPAISAVPVTFLDMAARRKLLDVFRPIDRELAALAGTGSAFFADLEEIASVNPDAISDVDAYRRWGRIAEAATRDRFTAPREPLGTGEAAVSARSGLGI